MKWFKPLLLIAALTFSLTALADWQAPQSAPPTCRAGDPGCDPPINVSDKPQFKKTGGSIAIGYSTMPIMTDPQGNQILSFSTKLGGLFEGGLIVLRNLVVPNSGNSTSTAGYVLTAVDGTGLVKWAPPTGGPGGGFWQAIGASTHIRNTNEGNVGIGDVGATPQAKLTVQGNALLRESRPALQLYKTNTDKEWSLVAGVGNYLYIKPAAPETVRDDTDASVWVTPAPTAGDAALGIKASRAIQFGQTAGQGTRIDDGSGSRTAIQARSSKLHILTQDGLGFGALRAGGVGIGTDPAAGIQLHTTGTMRFAGIPASTVDNRIVTTDTNGNVSYRVPDASWPGGGGGGGITQLNQGVGITLTPNPITTTGTVATDFTQVMPFISGTNGQTLRYNGTTNQWEASGNLVNTGTNVGIGAGASVPASKLHVDGTVRVGTVVGSGTSNGDIFLIEPNGIPQTTLRFDAQRLRFWTPQFGEVFTVSESGNTTVGTASGGRNLTVNGTVTIKGGGPAAGRVLTASDTSGNATWQPAGGTPSLNCYITTPEVQDWPGVPGIAPVAIARCTSGYLALGGRSRCLAVSPEDPDAPQELGTLFEEGGIGWYTRCRPKESSASPNRGAAARAWCCRL